MFECVNGSGTFCMQRTEFLPPMSWVGCSSWTRLHRCSFINWAHNLFLLHFQKLINLLRSLLKLPNASSHPQVKHATRHDYTNCSNIQHDSENMSLPDFAPNLPPPPSKPSSQGKWNCEAVSAEFQHPRAKIILLWAHAHAGPSAGSTAKWTDAKRGLVSRGARSVGNTGGWRQGASRKCEQLHCIIALSAWEA